MEPLSRGDAQNKRIVKFATSKWLEFVLEKVFDWRIIFVAELGLSTSKLCHSLNEMCEKMDTLRLNIYFFLIWGDYQYI